MDQSQTEQVQGALKKQEGMIMQVKIRRENILLDFVEEWELFPPKIEIWLKWVPFIDSGSNIP